MSPFKDGLFAYPATLSDRDGGRFRTVDYQELRDINKRDSVPERRVRRQYVDMAPKALERDLALMTSAGTIRFGTVGRVDSARLMTVFIHGRGGDRSLGMNDVRFGGNFNRIKNLMVRNNGLYLVPDAGSFEASDVTRIAELIELHLAEAPSARLVLVCASAGGAVCYDLANRSSIVGRLAGMGFWGSFWNSNYLSSAAARAKVPVYITHGSADSIFNVTDLEGFYTRLRDGGVPVRMVRFETGGHGTPIRMSDWRDMINWMVGR